MPTAKKTTKKSATKKTTAQKTAAKKTGSRSVKKGKTLVAADSARCFWTTDGQVLRDLRELEAALRAMTERVYLYHATKEHNDFAEWVEHVLLDKECADALRKSKTQQNAATVVVRYLKVYTT